MWQLFMHEDGDADAWVREWSRSPNLPGHFFRAPDAEPGEPRPLVVLDNGSDGATSHLGLFGGWAALERGYHAMTFDGPGQQAALFRLRLARSLSRPARIPFIGRRLWGGGIGELVKDHDAAEGRPVEALVVGLDVLVEDGQEAPVELAHLLFGQVQHEAREAPDRAWSRLA
jgi:hypothetical protein